MLFELYLVQSEQITADQLVAAMTLQCESRPKLGQLACEAGKLTKQQVLVVLDEQAGLDPPEPFGETAVRLGFLTKNELGHLLRQQRNLTAPLTSCLIELGAIDADALERALTRFRHLATDPEALPPQAELFPTRPLPNLGPEQPARR